MGNLTSHAFIHYTMYSMILSQVKIRFMYINHNVEIHFFALICF